MRGSSGSPEPPARGDGWVVAQALLLLAIAVTGLAGPSWGGITPWLLVPLGALLLAAGGLLVLLGARGLGSDLTPFPRPRRESALVEAGVYARVRHPIYGGLMLAAPGWAALTASPAALVLGLVLIVFLVLKARHEERLLERQFPGYGAYRERVRRRFLPYVA